MWKLDAYEYKNCHLPLLWSKSGCQQSQTHTDRVDYHKRGKLTDLLKELPSEVNMADFQHENGILSPKNANNLESP